MEKIQSKYIKFGLALGAGVLALTGCAESEQFNYSQPGTVTQHEYDDPDTYTTFILVGKVMVPMVHHDPAHYYLDVEQCGHEDQKTDTNPQGCYTFQEEVSEQTYNQFADGASITLQK